MQVFDLEEIWKNILKKNQDRLSVAVAWLSLERGFKPDCITSGFSDLYRCDSELFHREHQNFIENRVMVGMQIVAPLRSPSSEKVKNLFFRTMYNTDKETKSRLLPNVNGWGDEDGSPRGFGLPHLIKDFPHIILCEGMADYFAAESLLAEETRYLAIGASSALGLVKWASWLAEHKYRGEVTLLYQLDEKKESSSLPVGQKCAADSLKILKNNLIKANFFDWFTFLHELKSNIDITKINDIADVCKEAKNSALDFCNFAEHFKNSIKNRQ